MSDCKSTCESLAGSREALNAMWDFVRTARQEIGTLDVVWDHCKRDRIIKALDMAAEIAEGEINADNEGMAE